MAMILIDPFQFEFQFELEINSALNSYALAHNKKCNHYIDANRLKQCKMSNKQKRKKQAGKKE